MTRNSKPLAIDLFCGLGGWTEGLLAEGYDVVGFDIERHDYGSGSYPAQLVIQDVITLHGSQFRNATLIVASPPCQRFSRRAMPFGKNYRDYAQWDDDGGFHQPYVYPSATPDRRLFDACFRIQREACEEAGRYIPLVVENVKGAQPWVGRARWHFGSYYLWGDVPTLMPPIAKAVKNGSVGTWFGISHGTMTDCSGHPRKALGLEPPQGVKASQPRGDEYRLTETGVKTAGHLHIRNGHGHTRHLTNPAEHRTKQHGSGEIWFDQGIASLPSSSNRRKAASAQIAKIPLPLSRHIARVYHPDSQF